MLDSKESLVGLLIKSVERNSRVIESITRFCRVSHVIYPSNRERNETPLLKEIIDKNSITEKVLPYRKDAVAIRKLVNEFSPYKFDLFVSFNYSQIIDKSIIKIPRLGIVNFHCANLPEYRGANVLNWLIINGEKESFITLHYIDAGIDSGDIIAEKQFDIHDNDTIATLSDRIFELEIDLLEQELPGILLNQNSRFKQDERLARHYKPRNAEDGKFSWQETSDSIYNLIRALVKPWPGAFFYTDEGEKITIDYFLEKRYIEEIKNSKIYSSKFCFDNYIEENGIRQN